MSERWHGERSSDEIATNEQKIKTDGTFFGMIREMGKRVVGKFVENPFVTPPKDRDDPTIEYNKLMLWLEANRNDEGTWSQRLSGIVERQEGIRPTQYNSAMMEMNRRQAKDSQQDTFLPPEEAA
jgi:hypothetical protein